MIITKLPLLILPLLFSFIFRHSPKGFVNSRENVFATPKLFAPGIISTAENSEFDLYFSPDGKRVYFTRRKGNEKQRIWQSEFSNGVWMTPVLCSFSTDRDEAPFISPDGNSLYFGSARPIEGRPSKGNFDMNVWKVQRDGGDWGKPHPLGEEINAVQQEKEEWPSSNENFVSSIDGVNFVFSTMRRGTKTIDIYKTQLQSGSFTTPEKIDPVFAVDKYWKSSAILSPDGQYLLFNAYGAEGGAGGEDIFVCRKIDGGWSKAKSIGRLVNTATEEANPRFSPDGKYFYFGREIKADPSQDGIWSIFYIETRDLHLEKLFDH